jgi:hypothetical protein
MDKEIVINKNFIIINLALLIKTRNNCLQIIQSITMREIHIKMVHILEWKRQAQIKRKVMKAKYFQMVKLNNNIFMKMSIYAV